MRTRRDHKTSHVLPASVEDDIVVAVANDEPDEVFEIIEKFIASEKP